MPAIVQIEQAPSYSHSNAVRGTLVQDTFDTAYAAFHYYLVNAISVEQLTRSNYHFASPELIDLQFHLQPINVTAETVFNRLAERWKRETGMFSVVQQKMIHPSYLEIIGMSWSALPFLIMDMQKGAAHWFPALRAIAGDKKPDDSDAANFEEAARIWTEWWQRQNYGTMDTISKRAAIS